jgi:phosphate-selective porin
MLLLLRSSVVVLLLCAVESTMARGTAQDSLPKTSSPSTHSPAKWYDKISIKGYSQFRYNRLLETNSKLKCEQCDKGIGNNQTFEFRRARLILSGNIHERVFLYLQFDYSSDASETNKHFLQVRDAYADLAFDKKKKEYRLRFGQSKVPFGFDNLQSSSNRLPLDRSDALNSGVPNERDFGAFFYYAPANIRERFKTLLDDGLKGSSDYGVFGIGLYNGQTTNKPELNNDLHAVARLSYPFKIGRQIIEPGIQAYSGQYTIAKDKLSAGVKTLAIPTYLDQRVAASLVLYPQPFGIQAEYNVGKGPTFDATADSITVQKLKGGYVTASYRTKIGKKQVLIPYLRYQVYDGGKKHEQDARYYEMKEMEIGAEWLPFKNLEITLAYVISQRQYADLKTDYDQKGNFMRLQMQLNY